MSPAPSLQEAGWMVTLRKRQVPLRPPSAVGRKALSPFGNHRIRRLDRSYEQSLVALSSKGEGVDFPHSYLQKLPPDGRGTDGFSRRGKEWGHELSPLVLARVLNFRNMSFKGIFLISRINLISGGVPI